MRLTMPHLYKRLSIRSKLLILMGLPLVLLLVLSAFLLFSRFEEYETAGVMRQNVHLLRTVSAAVNHLQRERGRSLMYLNGGSGRTDLDAQQAETDGAVQSASELMQTAAIKSHRKDSEYSAINQLQQVRTAVNGHCSSAESFQQYTNLIARLLDIEKLAVEGKTTKGIGKRFVNVILLENAKEYAGQMRATISGVLTAAKPIDEDMVLKIAKLKASVECNLTSPALSLDEAACAQIATKMESEVWREVNRVFRIVLAKASKGQFGLDPATFFSTITKQVDDIGIIAECEVESVAAKAKIIQAEAVRDLWALGGGLALAVLLAGVLSAVLAGGIIGAIRRTTNMLKDISEGEGDLTKRLTVTSQDEIGEMAQYFNQFIEKLQGIIGHIAGNISTVASSATELSATATQLASGAEETTNQSAQVAAAAEQMSTNMGGMAAATEQMSTNIKVVASAIEELTSSISEVSKSAERAAGVADNAAQLVSTSNSQIGELGGAADEIGKVIEVIQDIAEQTNLLALNATIEAARAGDAGKGFAVVATEVKELAKQTASATEDIRKRIKGIQGSSGRAVKSIGDISDVVKQVNELSRMIASVVEEQSITTKEIARNMVQSSNAAQMVSRGVAESATATQEITRNIVGVDQAARQSAQGAAQTQTTSRELSTVAEQLQGLVGQFKV